MKDLSKFNNQHKAIKTTICIEATKIKETSHKEIIIKLIMNIWPT